MNRRNALKGLAAGLAAFPGLVPDVGDTHSSSIGKLFPTDLPSRTPTEFAAKGFRQPLVGWSTARPSRPEGEWPWAESTPAS